MLLHPAEGVSDHRELVIDRRLLVEGGAARFTAHVKDAEPLLDDGVLRPIGHEAGLEGGDLFVEARSADDLERAPRRAVRDREADIELDQPFDPEEVIRVRARIGSLPQCGGDLLEGVELTPVLLAHAHQEDRAGGRRVCVGARIDACVDGAPHPPEMRHQEEREHLGDEEPHHRDLEIEGEQHERCGDGEHERICEMNEGKASVYAR